MSFNALKFPTATFNHFKARAKLLAREDRLMRVDLVRIRRENGLTQQDVAELMGVSQQAVNKLERYDADPKLSTLRRYSNAVGALVEHRVAADQGQSLAIKVRTGWVGGTQKIPISDRVLVSRQESAVVTPLRAGWSLPKRTDYALSA